MPLDPVTSASSAIGLAWGEGADAQYEALAAPFRPVFERIRAGSLERELNRILPTEPLRWLSQSGFTALRLPVEEGGKGASLPHLFNLLIELSQADSNLTQALRSHFGYVEHVLKVAGPARRAVWTKRLANGELVGGAWSETGDSKQSGFATRLTRGADGLRLNGTKFYTTGSLFADWVHVAASDEAGETVGATVPRHAPGVTILDDWDGVGQRLTGSGTARFENVLVPEEEFGAELHPVPYAQAYYQLVHLATLAGIGRAAADDLARTLAKRRRSFSHAAAPNPPQDPQLLQVVGHVRAAAYGAGAIVLQAARALQRAADAVGLANEASANEEAELEIWQAQRVVPDLILDATARLFEALGASALQREAGLDRYWRNARTLTSHNPRIYRDRIVGDFAVNGTEPPRQWRIGLP